MSALGGALASGLDTRYQTRVVALEQEEGWWLRDETGIRYGPYTATVVALPAPQAVSLLAAAPALAAQACEAEFAPCWAMMAAWPAHRGCLHERRSGWREGPVVARA